MISSNDFRTGTTIEIDGAVWRVVEFLHVKPGKGSAFVRSKLKAVKTGNVVEKTFRAGEMLPQALLEKASLQHTYMEGEDYVFMDMSTYEETRLSADQIGESRKYLKEGMEVNVVSWNGSPLEVELPNSVVLEITQTDPGVKGDTATGGTKPAILETGAQVMVPLFLSVGEKIKVDTRSDSYLGRENGGPCSWITNNCTACLRCLERATFRSFGWRVMTSGLRSAATCRDRPSWPR